MCWKDSLRKAIICSSLFYFAVGVNLTPLYAQGSLLEGWQFNIDNKLGAATYEEEESDIEGEWSNFYYRLDASLDNLRNLEVPFKLKAGLGYFLVPTDTETWYIKDIQFQTNDMDFWGLNPCLEAGYRFGTGLEQTLSLTPFVGYGYKHIKFKRTNFNILNLITSSEVVSETYSIHYLGLGCYLDYALNERWGIFSRLAYNYVINNKADNSVLGKIDGGGGYLTQADLGLEYRLNEQSSLALGGFVELQHLRGGETQTVIWPDNDLNSYGGLISYKLYLGVPSKPLAERTETRPVTLPRVTIRPKAEPSSLATEWLSTLDEYYERIREIIRGKIFKLPNLEEGEVYLALSITSNGRLDNIYVIDERSEASPELKSSIIESVSELKQLPQLPENIGRDKISLVVPIVISGQEKKEE